MLDSPCGSLSLYLQRSEHPRTKKSARPSGQLAGGAQAELIFEVVSLICQVSTFRSDTVLEGGFVTEKAIAGTRVDPRYLPDVSKLKLAHEVDDTS